MTTTATTLIRSCLSTLDDYFHQLGGAGRYPGHRDEHSILALGLLLLLRQQGAADLPRTQPQLGCRILDLLEATRDSVPQHARSWIPVHEFPPSPLINVWTRMSQADVATTAARRALCSYVARQSPRIERPDAEWREFRRWVCSNSSRGSRDWLAELIHRAHVRKWCTSPCCTTCGANEFRSHYLLEARDHAGVAHRQPARASRRGLRATDVLADLDAESLSLVADELAQAARRLPSAVTRTEDFRLIMMDLDALHVAAARRDELDATLAETPAGAGLQRMVEHSQRLAEQRAHVSVAWWDEEAMAAHRAQRRAERAREAATKQARQKQEQAARNRRRNELLEMLRGMAPLDRLAWLADQPRDFPLDSIPIDLIRSACDSCSLSPRVHDDLIERIGQRGNPWKRLKRRLLGELPTD